MTPSTRTGRAGMTTATLLHGKRQHGSVFEPADRRRRRAQGALGRRPPPYDHAHPPASRAWRPTSLLAPSRPRGPRTPVHLTLWVSMIASRGAMAPAAAALATGQGAHQLRKQAALHSAPEPAVHCAPGRKARRKRPQAAAHPQVPGDRRQNQTRRRRLRTAWRVGPRQEAGCLVQARLRHDIFQARLVTRPMLVRPHLLSTPLRQADVLFGSKKDGGRQQRPSNRLSENLIEKLYDGLGSSTIVVVALKSKLDACFY